MPGRPGGCAAGPPPALGGPPAPTPPPTATGNGSGTITGGTGYGLTMTGGLRGPLDGPSPEGVLGFLGGFDGMRLAMELPLTPDGLMRGALLTLKALAPTLPDTAANLGGDDICAANASTANGMEVSVAVRTSADEAINLAPERLNGERA